MTDVLEDIEHRIELVDRELAGLAEARADLLTGTTPSAAHGGDAAARCVDLLAERRALITELDSRWFGPIDDPHA